MVQKAIDVTPTENGLAVVEPAELAHMDIRALAISGKELFTSLKHETLEETGETFYIADIREKETDRGRSLVMDVYDTDGVIKGRMQIARLAVLEQVDDLMRAYPTATVFGPFKFSKLGKTYKLVAVA